MKRTYKTDTIALKKLMIDRGIPTFIDLSAATGINRNTLAKVFRGEVQPSALVMDRLVEVLRIPPEQAGVIFFNSNLRTA